MAKSYVVVREQPDRSSNWYKYLYANVKENGKWTTECLQYLGKADGPEDRKITKDMVDDEIMDEHDIDVQDINEANIHRKWTRTGYKNDPSHEITIEERDGKYVVVVDMKETGHFAEKEFDTKEEAVDYAKKKMNTISNTWKSQEGWQDISDKATGKEALEDSSCKTDKHQKEKSFSIDTNKTEKKVETKKTGKGRVDVGDEYYHTRQRDPDKYSKVRIPKWTKKPAESVAGKGAKAKMGKKESSDEWEVQSVLIPKKEGRSAQEAQKLAKKVKKKIEG